MMQSTDYDYLKTLLSNDSEIFELVKRIKSIFYFRAIITEKLSKYMLSDHIENENKKTLISVLGEWGNSSNNGAIILFMTLSSIFRKIKKKLPSKNSEKKICFNYEKALANEELFSGNIRKMFCADWPFQKNIISIYIKFLTHIELQFFVLQNLLKIFFELYLSQSNDSNFVDIIFSIFNLIINNFSKIQFLEALSSFYFFIEIKSSYSFNSEKINNIYKILQNFNVITPAHILNITNSNLNNKGIYKNIESKYISWTIAYQLFTLRGETIKICKSMYLLTSSFKIIRKSSKFMLMDFLVFLFKRILNLASDETVQLIFHAFVEDIELKKYTKSIFKIYSDKSFLLELFFQTFGCTEQSVKDIVEDINQLELILKILTKLQNFKEPTKRLKEKISKWIHHLEKLSKIINFNISPLVNRLKQLIYNTAIEK